MRRPSLPTYFSHSYRLPDQDINKKFWILFEEQGFYFSVDPPSNATIHAHLERMMRRSSCYVAVVNRRLEEKGVFCSKFILYELGLSIQARRPRLLLIDEDIGSDVFNEFTDDEKYVFSPRNDPLGDGVELSRKIRKLRQRSQPVAAGIRRQRGPIGFLVPEAGARSYGSAGVGTAVEAAAQQHGFQLATITVPCAHNSDFAIALDRCEAVVLDVRGTILPPWVFAYIHGRLVPSIKLARVKPSEVASSIQLPPVVQALQMDEHEPAVESVTFWRDREDLEYRLSRAFDKLDEKPTELRGKGDGGLYFDSVGRRPARVFISNSGNANDFASTVSEQLRLHNIERFQYKDRGAIKTGSDWQKKILHELETCQIFVALLGKGYKDSPWCMKELQHAKRRANEGSLKMLPYRIDGIDASFLGPRLQATDLLKKSDSDVEMVLGEIDEILKHDTGVRQPMLLGGSREVVVDALRHLSKESWLQLHERLSDVGIRVPVGRSRAKIRPRQMTEQLLFAVQRAAPDRDKVHRCRSTLVYLVGQLVVLAPAKHRDVLSRVHDHLGKAADDLAKSA